jgi:hypothetical protein
VRRLKATSESKEACFSRSVRAFAGAPLGSVRNTVGSTTTRDLSDLFRDAS